jgi:energy-coupling factor transport system ATP-binding protein
MQAIGGECIVIKGNNGQGKSTLFKIMAGVLPVKTGLQLKINNELVKRNKILLYSGFVFQNPESNFFFNTLAEEVSPLENTDLLKLFFNESDYNRSPYLFSEGLINLALKKKILFLDEPTFGQDDENKKIIADIVLSLKKMGALVFMISHDNKFIQSVADRIFKLEDGALEEIK